MLTVRNLTKEFQSGDDSVVALHDVSFDVPTGQFAAIVGPSGSGKSTLLALLGALDSVSSGTIKVDGEDLATIPQRALTAYRRRKIGFVFQSYNLIPNLTAHQNVMLPMELMGMRRKARSARATELLDQVELGGAKADRRPGKLSGGEQQRVAIARALANHPKILLADEPTGNLDSRTGRVIVDLLHSLAGAADTTVLAVTHDASVARRTDRIFRLSDGKLIA